MLFPLALWTPVALGASMPIDPESSFDVFRKKFNKIYESTDIEAMRKEIFKANVAKINLENSKGLSYILGVGPFADLTLDEFRDRIRSQRPKNIWGKLKKLGDHVASDNVPDEVDWTKRGAVVDVKNQGMCGSCWAFSATGALEGALALTKGGRLVSLSEQNIMDCDKRDHKCRGGLMDNAFEYVKKRGLCSERTYPYECKYGAYFPPCFFSFCASNCDVVVQPEQVRGFRDVSRYSNAALMSALAQQPVAVAIEADAFVFQHYRSGVVTNEACGEDIDHGVLAVGYGVEDGVHYWKVKNSWGAEWGAHGYVKIAKDTAQESKGGICGILESASYPVLSESEKETNAEIIA